MAARAQADGGPSLRFCHGAVGMKNEHPDLGRLTTLGLTTWEQVVSPSGEARHWGYWELGAA